MTATPFPRLIDASPEGTATEDDVLVGRVRQGDCAAFELIMRRHNQRLYRLARSVLRNGPEATEAVQDAYLHAYEKLADYRGPRSFGAWLGRIVLNRALDRCRDLDERDAAQTAPILDVLQSAHDRLYSRLFQS